VSVIVAKNVMLYKGKALLANSKLYGEIFHWWKLIMAHGLSPAKKRQETGQGALPLMPSGRLRGRRVLVCLSWVSNT